MRATTTAKAKPTRTAKASTPAKATAKAAKVPAKTAAKAPAKAPARVTPPAPVASKDDKAKKPKMVRDSFTIPKAEYTALEELKQRAAKAGTAVKKSELLRAGIKTLVAMDDKQFAAAIGAVPAIKTGRPAKA